MQGRRGEREGDKKNGWKRSWEEASGMDTSGSRWTLAISFPGTTCPLPSASVDLSRPGEWGKS